MGHPIQPALYGTSHICIALVHYGQQYMGIIRSIPWVSSGPMYMPDGTTVYGPSLWALHWIHLEPKCISSVWVWFIQHGHYMGHIWGHMNITRSSYGAIRAGSYWQIVGYPIWALHMFIWAHVGQYYMGRLRAIGAPKGATSRHFSDKIKQVFIVVGCFHRSVYK